MKLLLAIAFKHLTARKRQSFVSLLGIVLGVAFFLAISSLMRGSENDFIKRLVDNSPHITVQDQFRTPRLQPVQQVYRDTLINLRNIKPVQENRGIRGYKQILKSLAKMPGVQASPVLAGNALLNFAGQEVGITLNGMIPEEIKNVSTIENYMRQGSIDSLIANPDGIVIGEALAKKIALDYGDVVTLTSAGGRIRNFKVRGIFRTGRSSYDEATVFLHIKRVQALLNRPNRANSIIVKIPDAYQARSLAMQIEQRIGYKCVSWQEASEDIMNTLTIRNIIMYTVVSAVLVVAAFGIYNVISTVVLEKQRDISILKSMGFTASDVQRIFMLQGLVLGLMGCLLGLPLGSAIMGAMMQIRLKPPGGTDMVNMPIDWGLNQFAIAAAFALCASLLAATLPARKASRVQPVDILRGGM